MVDVASIMQGDSSSVEDIGAEVVALLDAPADDEGTPAEEADPEVEAGDADEAGTTDGGTEDGDAAEPAEPADFLQASGVTLEEFLEGVEDPEQRAFLENRYKSMQAHWTRRNQEMARATDEGKAALTENEELKARLLALEQRQQPQAVQQPENPQDIRQRFIYQGIDKVMTPEEAVESPKAMAEFVRQQAIIAARESQLPVLDAINRRVAPIEMTTQQMVSKESAALVNDLFAQAPHMRTPQVEAQMVALMQANPNLPLEAAFNAVVAPLLATDAFSVGQRTAQVSARRSAEETLAAKQRASVPSAAGNTGVGDDDLPDKPSIEESFAYAQRYVDGR